MFSLTTFLTRRQLNRPTRSRRDIASCTSPIMAGLSWEEKYLRLRDDHTSLTHKANEQDDTIRRCDLVADKWQDTLGATAARACSRAGFTYSLSSIDGGRAEFCVCVCFFPTGVVKYIPSTNGIRFPRACSLLPIRPFH